VPRALTALTKLSEHDQTTGSERTKRPSATEPVSLQQLIIKRAAA